MKCFKSIDWCIYWSLPAGYSGHDLHNASTSHLHKNICQVTILNRNRLMI